MVEATHSTLAAPPGTAVEDGPTTPALLKQWLGVIVVSSLLSAVGALVTAQAIGDAARVIGRDAEPSVALALKIEARLAEMDASALADSLVQGGLATGTSLHFAEDKRGLTGEIEEAAHLADSDAGAAPLRELQVELLNYEQAVVEARYIGQGRPWLATKRQEWASRINRFFAIPAARALQRVNANVLEQRYGAFRDSSANYGLAVGGGCAVLVIWLIGAQRWLTRRTRRLFNPPMLAAAVLAVYAGLALGWAVMTARSRLETVKHDAYDNLHALYQAKAAVSALHADASLWLFDVTAQQDATTQMDGDASLLTGRPLHVAGRVAGHPQGLFGTEAANAAFGGPQGWAEARRLLTNAMRAIGVMQVQQARGLRAEAIAQWVSEEDGGGGTSFAALQAALDRAIAANQSTFDQSVADTLAAAATLRVGATLALLAAGVLGGVGLMLRLREYL